jgi:hypothetical protein
MSFVSVVALSFAPVLVAILAAALILPRAWLAFYAVFVIVALVLYADLSGRYDDAAFGSMFSALFSMLAAVTLVAGLITRWALKSRPPQSDG